MSIEYPYLPPNRAFKYVPADHPFMVEAARAREELAGDPSYPVGIVMVKDSKVGARAGNGFNRGRQVHVCPRIVLECPTGVGYELCDLHDPPGHAEPQVLKEARAVGIDPAGSDLYMYGHWWCCEPCWAAMIQAGIRDVYVVDDAHERFSRERVYGETLAPSFKTVSLEGIDGALLDELATAVASLGLTIVATDPDVRCVMTADGIQCWPRGHAAPVYTVPNGASIARQVANVLKQL